ncbi:MAG: PilW family protein [Gammaproteobacteria bacterium]
MKKMKTKRRVLQCGLTLVELMVAMVVSLILMAGVLKIYLSSKQSSRVLTSEARMQENGRFAMHFLVHDIRMAGYMGCASFNRITPNIIANPPPAQPVFSSDNIIRGFDYTGSSWPGSFPQSTGPNGAPPNIVSGTSVIVLQYGSSDGAELTGNVNPVNANVQVTHNAGNWVKGSYVLITDCSGADLFKNTNNTTSSNGSTGYTLAYGSSGNTTNRLSRNYGRDAQTMSYESDMYYIGTDANDLDSHGQPRPALYRMDFSGNRQALVDNVQSMKILYGLDTSGDRAANEYLTAAQVDAISPATNGWPDVVSARVNLLLSTTDDNLAPSRQTVTFDGSNYNAGDRRLYWTFGDTVTLRNRAN